MVRYTEVLRRPATIRLRLSHCPLPSRSLFLFLHTLSARAQPLCTLSSPTSFAPSYEATERSIPFLVPILYRFRLSALPLSLSAILSLFVPFTHRSHLPPFPPNIPQSLLSLHSSPQYSPQCVTLSLIHHVVPAILHILVAFISQLPVLHSEYFLRSLVLISFCTLQEAFSIYIA